MFEESFIHESVHTLHISLKKVNLNLKCGPLENYNGVFIAQREYLLSSGSIVLN